MFLCVLRSPHTDPVASLGMAGVANPLELKKWIGMYLMVCVGVCKPRSVCTHKGLINLILSTRLSLYPSRICYTYIQCTCMFVMY